MILRGETRDLFSKSGVPFVPWTKGAPWVPSTRERRVQGAVEGSFICSSGPPFLLPARGPLTSPLLLLANCDAADTLVMFSASFVRPLPASPPPSPPLCRAHHIRNRGPSKTWNSTANLLCLEMLLLLLPTMEFEGSCTLSPFFSVKEGRWFWFEIQLDFFFFFLVRNRSRGSFFRTSDLRSLHFSMRRKLSINFALSVFFINNNFNREL